MKRMRKLRLREDEYVITGKVTNDPLTHVFSYFPPGLRTLLTVCRGT